MAQLGMAMFYTAAWQWDYPHTNHRFVFKWYQDRGKLLWRMARVITEGTIL